GRAHRPGRGRGPDGRAPGDRRGAGRGRGGPRPGGAGAPAPDGRAAAARARQPRLRRGPGGARPPLRAQETGIAVDVGLGLTTRLPPEAETILYRITQESLTNVAKHARAGHVTVTVDELDDGRVRLRVRDDGVGFDTSSSPPRLREGHYGLAGMRERASLVGGTLEIGSIPGHGTTIEVRLPTDLAPPQAGLG